jgi:hypothetical protein
MKFVITADHRAGDGIKGILDDLDASGYRATFRGLHYGPGLDMVGIVLRALSRDIAGYDRSRLDRKSRFFGADLRIISEEFDGLTPELQRRVVADLIRDKFIPAVRRVKIKEFDSKRLAGDITRWLYSLGWNKPNE